MWYRVQEAMRIFLSTPSARRATLHGHEQRVGVVISIHALREEGDLTSWASSSPTAKFLSTPSARRATALVVADAGDVPISIHALREEGDRGPGTPHRPLGYFYPRPPRGGRQVIPITEADGPQFLSTPSARRATSRICPLGARRAFLSTPSARRATTIISKYSDAEQISIHALREEGDMV